MFRLTLSILCLAAPLSVAWAAPLTPEKSDPPSNQQIEDLVSRIEDPQRRKQLIDDLEALKAASDDSSGEVLQAQDVWDWTITTTTALIDDVQGLETRAIAVNASINVLLLLALVAIRYGLRRAGRAATFAIGKEGSSPTGNVLLSRTTDFALVAIALFLTAEVWGANPSALLASRIDSALIESALGIGLVVVLTLVTINIARSSIKRTVRRRRAQSERQQQRLQTLEPLLTSIVQVTILLLAALLVLSELGINVGPLLAGAGVVGIAIGFGAQTLVKDLITGVTLLLEDAASIGDIIETGGHFGRIEKMRLRVMRLRDLASVVHIIPYSEVTSIKNYTKDYSHYVFDIGVAYKEDIANVIDILKELGETFRDEEAFRESILEPLEILGVDRFKDSAVNIRARIKTRPQDRWNVGWAFNERIKRRFDEKGIEIPFPHTTLYFGQPKEGEAPPLPLDLQDKRRAATSRQ